MTYALIGNQNCGKTTLFNALTSSQGHVGNFPGVTVSLTKAQITASPDITLVDLPGVYSLSPYSADENVTQDFLFNNKVDCIINIVDVNTLERGLYLTTQLIPTDIPMVVGLNMMDELLESGGSVDTALISQSLGIPVFAISAAKGTGIDLLLEGAKATSGQPPTPRPKLFTGLLGQAIGEIEEIISATACAKGLPPYFTAIRLFLKDSITVKNLSLSLDMASRVDNIVSAVEKAVNMDNQAILAKESYDFLENLAKSALKLPFEHKQERVSGKIDRILTHKLWGIPIFLGILLSVFWLTFDVIGSFFSDLLAIGIDFLCSGTVTALEAIGAGSLFIDLVENGIFAGVGGVLSFLPIIMTLFFFLSLMEDSGYMARIAFIMDRPLQKIGLSGKSFVPMLMGFGCSVPAILATRTLPSKSERVTTIALVPFMSCSAKLPVYAMLAGAFFPKHRAVVMLGLYLFGVAMAVLTAYVIKKTLFKKSLTGFMLELPNYRFPTAKNTTRLMWSKAKDFLQKAFTVIFAATIVIWFLQTFTLSLDVAPTIEQSILHRASSLISPIFSPLGFSDSRAVTALITGFTAKEAVLSTLEMLVGSGTLADIFTPLSALSFLAFTLLYTPCMAAIAAIKRELGAKTMSALIGFQLISAWCCAFLVYQIGWLLIR